MRGFTGKLCLIFIFLFSLLFSINSWGESLTEKQIKALKRQMEEIQRQNQQQIEELKKKIEELEAQKEAEQKKIKELTTKKEEEKEAWWKNIEAGYKDGMYIRTKDERFELKFRTRLQSQFFFKDFDEEKDRENEVDFRIRRARLYFLGNVFYPWLKYYTQLTLEGGSISLRDYYVDLAYYKELTPRLGQFKVPFNREELTSSAELQFVERSIVNEEFSFARDIGVMLHGGLPAKKELFEYGIGIFNGAGKNQTNVDDDIFFVARAMFTPFGKYKYSQGALENPEHPLLAIGAAVGILPGFEPEKEGISDRSNLGEAVEAIGSAKSDVVQFTTDLAFKYRRFSFEGEYDLRHISPEEDGIESVTAHGFRVQTGFFLIPKHVEAAFRYAFIDPNDNQSEDRKQEFTPALSYYIFGHNLKVQASYSLLLEENPEGGSFKDNEFRIQFQFYF